MPAKVPAGYMDTLKDLIAAGKIKPVVDRVYPLPEIADAHRYVEAGHKRGGVAIAMIPIPSQEFLRERPLAPG